MGSMKFKSITAIENDIVDIIDGNQSIKRYIKYLTDNPLGSRGKLANGKLIDQPDITESLIGNDKNIIPSLYREDCLEYETCLIFIYSHKGDLSSKTIGEFFINIDVLVPTAKDIMSDLREKRTFAIANEICNSLDDIKFGNGKGLSSFRLIDFVVERVSKEAEYTIVSLSGVISTSNMRDYR